MASQKMKSELSTTDKQILIIVLILIFAFLVGLAEFFLVYKKQDAEHEKLKETIISLEPKVAEAEAVPKQIVDLQNKINNLMGVGNDATSNAEHGLNEVLDVPTILAIVESSASQAGLELNSIDMNGNAAYVKGGIIANQTEDSVADANNFAKLGISLSVKKVTYEGLMKFLKNLEDAGYYITTSKTNLIASEELQGAFSGDIDFYIYSYNTSKTK